MKKLLYTLIFFVCILASCFVTNSVFAGEFVFNGETYETSSEFDEYISPRNHILIAYSSSTQSYCIFGFDDELVVTYRPHNYYPTYGFSTTSTYFSYGWVDSLNDLFLTSYSINVKTLEPGSYFLSIDAYDSGSTNLVYSNFDVYYENKLLFRGAPRLVEQVIIPEIQSAEEIPQAITQVMRILIPIGLIIFGIGLVIYLIRLVALRVT